MTLCLSRQFTLANTCAIMSGSSGCGGDGFFLSDLSVELLGVSDAVAVERARRARFLLRRRDPEFLEIVLGMVAPADAPGSSPPGPRPVALRRSRSVMGLEAEYEEVIPDPHRRRLK